MIDLTTLTMLAQAATPGPYVVTIGAGHYGVAQSDQQFDPETRHFPCDVVERGDDAVRGRAEEVWATSQS